MRAATPKFYAWIPRGLACLLIAILKYAYHYSSSSCFEKLFPFLTLIISPKCVHTQLLYISHWNFSTCCMITENHIWRDAWWFVCPFFLFAIALTVLLRFTVSGCPFDISKLFVHHFRIKLFANMLLCTVYNVDNTFLIHNLNIAC